eukprot:6883984-Lingulodinium_polyedra.AAC.1
MSLPGTNAGLLFDGLPNSGSDVEPLSAPAAELNSLDLPDASSDASEGPVDLGSSAASSSCQPRPS